MTEVSFSSRDYKTRGNDYFKEKSYSKAIEAYNSAIQLDPSNTSLYSNRCAAYIGKGNTKELYLAEKDARKALELDNTFIKAHYRLSSVLIAQKKYIEASNTIKNGLKLEKDNNGLLLLSKKVQKLLSIDKNKNKYKHMSNGNIVFGDICCDDDRDEELEMKINDIFKRIPTEHTSISNSLRKILRDIETNQFNVNALSQNMLHGTFDKLMDADQFRDILYPGITESNINKACLPKCFAEIFAWRDCKLKIYNKLPLIAKASYVTMEGTKARGRRQFGEEMDKATEQVLLPQIIQEELSRRVIETVREIQLKANKDTTLSTLVVADPVQIVDKDVLMMLDDNTLLSLYDEKKSIAYQDSFMGPEWSELVYEDVKRFCRDEKMTELKGKSLYEMSSGSSGSSGNNGGTSNSGGNTSSIDLTLKPLISLIDGASMQDYPALSEAFQILQCLPHEINSKSNTLLKNIKRNENIQFAQVTAGSMQLWYFPQGAKQDLRVDCLTGDQDTGIRLTCTYHISSSNNNNDNNNDNDNNNNNNNNDNNNNTKCGTVGHFASLQVRNDEENHLDESLLEIKNDRLILHQSQMIQNRRLAALEDYYVLLVVLHAQL